MHYRRSFALKPVLVATALFSCVLSAVAIVPDSVISPPATTITETLSLPQDVVAQVLPQSSFWREEAVKSGDTLSSLLLRFGVNDPDAISFIKSDPVARQLISAMRPNRHVRVETSYDGQLRSLRYPLNGKNELVIARDKNDQFTASEKAVTLETRRHFASGTIKSSLFGALDTANVPDGIAFQMAEILGTNIDFLRDLRTGDTFSVVYEAEYNGGRLAGSGRILALEFINKGKVYQALYFEEDNEKGAYYTPDFKPLRSGNTFLRSPLEFTRISSVFSMRRHPISREMRHHNGVDFAAPTGTKIKASANGVVSFAGWQTGYGNIIIIKHSSGYETRYGHQSRFVSGIRVGMKVTQGQHIGHVGSTGWSTGPHLHYEMRKNNQPVNPLDKNIVLEIDKKRQAKLEQAFMVAKAPLMASLDVARQVQQSHFE